mmetsp:Transcript_25271/g.59979  ORF Transcript_25271/g.59979 Transcript_25271/m.59979 type:complete len:213 (+) Transcript_25271:204-842(+)
MLSSTSFQAQTATDGLPLALAAAARCGGALADAAAGTAARWLLSNASRLGSGRNVSGTTCTVVFDPPGAPRFTAAPAGFGADLAAEASVGGEREPSGADSCRKATCVDGPAWTVTGEAGPGRWEFKFKLEEGDLYGEPYCTGTTPALWRVWGCVLAYASCASYCFCSWLWLWYCCEWSETEADSPPVACDSPSSGSYSRRCSVSARYNADAR